MRRLQTAPGWVLFLFNGVVFGLVVALVSSPPAGVLSGLFFALLVTRYQLRQRSRLADAYEAVDPAERRVATRASAYGPVPADPAVRAVAVVIAQQYRAEMARQRRWALPMYGVLIAASVGAAFTEPLSLLFTPVFVALLGMTLWWPTHLERRIARLRA